MLITLMMQMENFPNVSSLRMVCVMRSSRVSGISALEGFLIWLTVVGFWKKILLVLSRMLRVMLIVRERDRWIVVSPMIGIIRNLVVGGSLVGETLVLLVLPLSATDVVTWDTELLNARMMRRSATTVGELVM